MTDTSRQVFLENAKHLGQALVSEVDVARVHLIEDEFVAVVALSLPELSLELIKVERHVLSFLLRPLQLQGRLSLLFGVFYASLARLPLRYPVGGVASTIAFLRAIASFALAVAAAKLRFARTAHRCEALAAEFATHGCAHALTAWHAQVVPIVVTTYFGASYATPALA